MAQSSGSESISAVPLTTSFANGVMLSYFWSLDNGAVMNGEPCAVCHSEVFLAVTE